METIKVRKKYQITLPTVIREAAGVYEGDFLTAEVREDRTILLRPSRLVDADEAFFYTPAWQAAEREADEDLATGRYDDFETVADLIADLERQEDELSTNEAQ
ncbi:MAG: AbrB/MazE/SpoVT family DNA-binding domain-containing protein [Chloroflexota bacterium]|nr:AbrB/MazE/SpoVT family DNA-binding domain-containing protein [Chloroflexota bacterium]